MAKKGKRKHEGETAREAEMRVHFAKVFAAPEQERAERRRRLANGFSRALSHLLDDEMTVIEHEIYRTIGRSIVQR